MNRELIPRRFSGIRYLADVEILNLLSLLLSIKILSRIQYRE
ncbi:MULTISPECIES: hypothetical protein [unclassified Microcoleus]|jgi:hypothetical protein|nr:MULTISPECIES: hypothetical protein [unclassified Microcoleus]